MTEIIPHPDRGGPYRPLPLTPSKLDLALGILRKLGRTEDRTDSYFEVGESDLTAEEASLLRELGE